MATKRIPSDPAASILAPTGKNERDKLLSDLERLLENPRAGEVLSNGWLHDASIPAPSYDLIQYLAFRLIIGHGIRLIAATGTREEIISKILQALREETAEERRASIKRVTFRLKCYKWLYSGKTGSQHKHAHEWLPVLSAFLYPSVEPHQSDSLAIESGTRVIARGILETMMLLAVFHWEANRIEGLAAALREIRDGTRIDPTLANRTAGEIIRWLPVLWNGIERRPSKSEMMEFIETIFPEFTPTPNDKSKAFKMVGWPSDDERIRKIDKAEIHRLALRERSTLLTD